MSVKGTIGFAGLSHLGIIYSMASAARGFSVLAFDDRRDLITDLSAGRFPVSEPGLNEAYLEHGARLRFTASAEALAECKLIFITLDVPTDEANKSNLAPLEALIERVVSVAGPDTAIAIMSQVPPGFCRKLTGRINSSLQLYYQVETLVFGNAMERAIRPERYMVGCVDPKQPFPDLYRQFLDGFDCPVLPMRYESAELCKIAINCFLVSSVSTTNTLAELCEKIHADWYEIAPALRLDRRIGPYAYLNPGLGIAGGNLERDLATVQSLAAESGSDARVVTAWQQSSAYMRDWVLRRLFQLRLLEDAAGAELAMWGIAYKPETHSTKNSPSLALLRSLAGYRWRACDPVARLEESEFPSVRLCDSPLSAVKGAKALVVMTPWKEFAGISLESVLDAMSGRDILDPHRILDGGRCRELGFKYHCLGA
jgi:UDPglucose 6-dehydrogenase